MSKSFALMAFYCYQAAFHKTKLARLLLYRQVLLTVLFSSSKLLPSAPQEKDLNDDPISTLVIFYTT